MNYAFLICIDVSKNAADSILGKGYFEWKKDFSNFALAMDRYITQFPDELNKYELNNSAWWLFEKIQDTKAIKSSLEWDKKKLEGAK